MRGIWFGLLLAFAIILAAPAAAQTTSPGDEEAHRRFEAGQLAFRDGRYETAISDFRAAYELSHHVQLLYNIGQCADRLRQDQEALDAFDQYLQETDESAPYRREVVARVEVLRAAIARGTEAAPEPTLDAPAETPAEVAPPPPGSDTNVAAMAVAFASGAVLVAGAVMLGIAESDRASVEHPAVGATWDQISGAASRGPILEAIGIAAVVVGAIGTVAGIVWAVIDTPSTHVDAHVGLDGLSIRGTF